MKMRIVGIFEIKYWNKNMSQPLRVKVRIIVVGESETGKTCLIKKFVGIYDIILDWRGVKL